jgi:multicomponent Na+:H+ antiporter subunit D
MSAFLHHPALVLVIGGVLIGALRGRVRSALILTLPVLALYLLWRLPHGDGPTIAFLDLELMPLAVDALARLFGTVFCIMLFAGGLFALHQERRLEVPAAFFYGGSAVGVALAGDLVTLFICWELMAIGSTLVLWSAGQGALRASMRYLAVHLFGGVLLMAGIAGHIADTGSIGLDRMQLDSAAHWLILAGFLVNVGAPPLSAWLPDAYPEASWSGMVFLSAFTTKAAVYVLLRGFPGVELLVYVGLFMVFYGIVYALLENDMRRILAYSIVNQVGFMVTGIGIGTEMALNGAAAHAFTHIIYKALLLMSAGSVLLMTARRKCTDLGGLFRSMPVTAVCGIIGALAISSFPLTSGFVSKSMISQSAADEHLLYVWLALVVGSAGVFLHAGIKFPWFVFFQKDSGLRPPDPPRNMRYAMLLFAVLCIALGIAPGGLYALLPYPVAYVPYTAAHVVTQLQLLLFSGLAFFVMLRFLRRTLTITLDTDWLYRALFPALIRAALRVWDAADRALKEKVAASISQARARLYRARALERAIARTRPTGSMALWMMVMLLAYLLLYYAK